MTSLFLLFFIFATDPVAAQGVSGSSYYTDFRSPVFHNVAPARADTLPDPKGVMLKSLMVPGWGQITNDQTWKVPIIYGLLGGLTWYSIYLNNRYKDFRAAFFNKSEDTPDDMRFGPTPDYLVDVSSLESLRSSRDSFRNRRDFSFIALALAYGLNVIDAFVYAHMRSFDVSDDLAVQTSVSPAVLENGTPGITLSVKLFQKAK